MEKMVGQTIETIVTLGEKTVKLGYGLLIHTSVESEIRYGIEVRMESEAGCEVKREERITTSLDCVVKLMGKMSEGIVMPYTLHEIVEDFVAMSPVL